MKLWMGRKLSATNAFPSKITLSVACDLRGFSRRSDTHSVIVLVVNGQIRVASQTNRAAASIGKGKPEFAYLGIELFDPGFFRPERRIPGGCGFNPNHSKVLCIHPNSAAVEEFVFG